MKLRPLFASLIVLASITPAHAFHDDELPVILEEEAAAGGWFRYDVSFEEGADFYIEEELHVGNASTAYMAMWIIEDGGSFAGLFGSRNGRGVRIATGPTGPIVDEPDTTGPGGMGAAVGYEDAPAGTAQIIIMAVSDGTTTEGSFRIGGTGLTVLDSARGDDAFLRLERDFEPETHVRAPDGLVEVAAAGTTTVNTGAPTFAWFVAQHDLGTVSYEGPGGSERTTPGSFPWVVLHGAPAGAHTFNVDAAVGAVFTGWVLVGAGVDLS